jgi:hypothetical protein
MSGHTQYIVSDKQLGLAATLAYMGYPFRVVYDPTGMQFLFNSMGDIEDAVQAYESGEQAASAKDLLAMYDAIIEQVRKYKVRR